MRIRDTRGTPPKTTVPTKTVPRPINMGRTTATKPEPPPKQKLNRKKIKPGDCLKMRFADGAVDKWVYVVKELGCHLIDNANDAPDLKEAKFWYWKDLEKSVKEVV